jgi:6-phosphogluconate dehydrogenase
VVHDLSKYLQKDDIIIDGGNSHYKETKRRIEELKVKKILYLGCGVSGGEEGALKGPSLMPGGSKKAWVSSKKLLQSIAAKDFAGGPCVTYLGPGGAGHFVKMVHNGIEYAVMELMAETYALLRRMFLLDPREVSKIFNKFNRSKLASYLFEIAVPVLAEGDELNNDSCCLIYSILDRASQKGTGKWASTDALDRGVAVPSITAAVFARYMSAEKKVRVRLGKKYLTPKIKHKLKLKRFIAILENALYAAMISSYAQGYDLIQKASEQEKWNIDLSEVSRIWEGGCIIRAQLLNVLHHAYNKKKDEPVLCFPSIVELMERNRKDFREIVHVASENGIPVPGFASSLYYFEEMTSPQLPANFIQGLRDYFGAHTYERIDSKGSFHTNWGGSV